MSRTKGRGGRSGVKKKGKAKQSYAKSTEEAMLRSRIQHRNGLMRNSAGRVCDLTSFDEIDLSALSIQTKEVTESDAKPLHAIFSVGFLGYYDSTPVSKVKINRTWLRNKNVLHQRILGCTTDILAKLGVVGQCRLYGCEVQYRSGYTGLQGTAESAAFAIIDTVDAFHAWMSQMTNEKMWTRVITARFVRADGSLFKPTFRTEQETIAETSPGKAMAGVGNHSGTLNLTDTAEFAKDVRSALKVTKIKKPRRDAMSRNRKDVKMLLPLQFSKSRAGKSLEDELLALAGSPPSKVVSPRSVSLPEIDFRQRSMVVDEVLETDTASSQDAEMRDML